MNVAYGADTECRLSTDVLHREKRLLRRDFTSIFWADHSGTEGRPRGFSLGLYARCEKAL